MSGERGEMPPLGEEIDMEENAERQEGNPEEIDESVGEDKSAVGPEGEANPESAEEFGERASEAAEELSAENIAALQQEVDNMGSNIKGLMVGIPVVLMLARHYMPQVIGPEHIDAAKMVVLAGAGLLTAGNVAAVFIRGKLQRTLADQKARFGSNKAQKGAQ